MEEKAETGILIVAGTGKNFTNLRNIFQKNTCKEAEASEEGVENWSKSHGEWDVHMPLSQSCFPRMFYYMYHHHHHHQFICHKKKRKKKQE